MHHKLNIQQLYALPTPHLCVLYLYETESFIFQFAIQKVKDQDIQNYNIARGSAWVWNLVADTEGRT